MSCVAHKSWKWADIFGWRNLPYAVASPSRGKGWHMPLQKTARPPLCHPKNSWLVYGHVSESESCEMHLKWAINFHDNTQLCSTARCALADKRSGCMPTTNECTEPTSKSHCSQKSHRAGVSLMTHISVLSDVERVSVLLWKCNHILNAQMLFVLKAKPWMNLFQYGTKTSHSVWFNM